jgi:hypothetical protein
MQFILGKICRVIVIFCIIYLDPYLELWRLVMVFSKKIKWLLPFLFLFVILQDVPCEKMKTLPGKIYFVRALFACLKNDVLVVLFYFCLITCVIYLKLFLCFLFIYVFFMSYILFSLCIYGLDMDLYLAPITQLLFMHTLYFRLAWGINSALLWFYPRLALMKPQISWKVYKVVDNNWCGFLRSIVFMPCKSRVNLFNIKLSKGLLFLVYKYPIFYT